MENTPLNELIGKKLTNLAQDDPAMAQNLINFQKNKEANQMLSRAMQQQVYQKEVIDSVLREDQWIHKFKSDPMKTVAWKSFH